MAIVAYTIVISSNIAICYSYYLWLLILHIIAKPEYITISMVITKAKAIPIANVISPKLKLSLWLLHICIYHYNSYH